MPSAYEASPSESTEIPRWKWRAVVAVFWLVVIGGVGLGAAIASGLFDPPYAPDLLLARADADGLPFVREQADARLYTLSLPVTPPFTLALTARNDGPGDTGWGLWLVLALPDGATQDVVLVITNDLEVSSPIRAPGQARLGLHEFPHIRAGENTVYAHLREDGELTLRINNELVETGRFPGATIAGGGVALYREAVMRWESVRVYGRATPNG
ncbi:MAG: hypothetical protein KC547_04180 [Anaerolineae bacterium]|nr:hypothetical protein [Anaerolineae bacterium]